ncbi:MAG TPA: PIN domain-containing protein [Mucilaginibacter sp.]|nr:PIN domain-containing protein [Mucilaginibacter sp.]
MKLIFTDTNILVDVLAERLPYSKYAAELFDLAEKKKVKLYTSSHSYATTHYLLKKYMEEAALRQALVSLLDFIEIIPIDVAIIRKGLHSKYKDFEDAIQIFAANTVNKLDFIVTRNLKDFKDAGVAVLSPDELLSHLI